MMRRITVGFLVAVFAVIAVGVSGQLAPMFSYIPVAQTSITQTPPPTCSIVYYDTFHNAPLNTNKWIETTVSGHPDEHFVNVQERRFHVAQLSSGIKDHHLSMVKGLKDETVEYDVYYNSGSGDQHMHNFQTSPYGAGWNCGFCYLGYSASGTPGLWGTQTGKYHIEADFNSAHEEVDLSIKRPDGTFWTGTVDLSYTSPPYYPLLQTSTTGTMHFDYDNVKIKSC